MVEKSDKLKLTKTTLTNAELGGVMANFQVAILGEAHTSHKTPIIKDEITKAADVELFFQEWNPYLREELNNSDEPIYSQHKVRQLAVEFARDRGTPIIPADKDYLLDPKGAKDLAAEYLKQSKRDKLELDPRKHKLWDKVEISGTIIFAYIKQVSDYLVYHKGKSEDEMRALRQGDRKYVEIIDELEKHKADLPDFHIKTLEDARELANARSKFRFLAQAEELPAVPRNPRFNQMYNIKKDGLEQQAQRLDPYDWANSNYFMAEMSASTPEFIKLLSRLEESDPVMAEIIATEMRKLAETNPQANSVFSCGGAHVNGVAKELAKLGVSNVGAVSIFATSDESKVGVYVVEGEGRVAGSNNEYVVLVHEPAASADFLFDEKYALPMQTPIPATNLPSAPAAREK